MASTDTKTTNNKRKKSSLLMCFKPVGMNNSFKTKRQKDKTSDKCFAVEEKEDKWQALRAVLNETSLMKKVISRKKSNKDYSSRSNSNLKEEEEEASDEISNSQSKSIQGTDSNISSSFGFSSAFTSSSLTSSNSSRTDQTSGSSSNESAIEVPNDQKQLYGVVEDRKKERYYGSMCMFFISLLVLIMWGKLFATLYTSIWFYLMPPRRVRVCNEGDINISGESEFDSVEYYKKVIVERTA